jgi:DNA repair protein RadC
MNKKLQIDIVNEVLEECIIAYPVSSFVISLYKQYGERGSLSKKQLQGLHSKASQIKDINPGKVATLEAIINKMPNRFKSEIPEAKPALEKDEKAGEMITEILAKYPEHKRVLYLKSKYDNNEVLAPAEISDLERFIKAVRK